MICPTCKEWDVGNGPWESWERCPNCDVHPDTSIHMQLQRRKIEDRDKKIERQKSIIRRLEAGAKSRKILIKKLHKKINQLQKLQYDH